ncbi:conjugal transfer protein [Streptomyces alfalfae]|uniref:conjugal transfer protein n=1 Tax=Streptomyces alfalfae TaxID=1642299 RepID=UPI001BA6AAA5|nr:conjugal transfer protein [Streptomyces alfalfae]QUI32454.1 conjugal transfer protein [Streptomyces alfalfae]
MNRTLNTWQYTVLGIAAVLMVAVGAFGGWGTYSNVQAQFHRGATAAGVVAAGEGLALVLALTMLCLTMLGQSSPAVVRIGLWIAPVGACATGVTIAETTGEAIVYGLTPMAMSGAAEGLGLIARRVTIYRTGVDAEAQRRNAQAVQQIAYQRAVAQHHPDEEVREAALRESWALAKKVGRGDAQLGADLVEVQRARIRNGADDALGGMYGRPPAKPSSTASITGKLRDRLAAMDPTDAIRLAHDARPDADVTELAHLLGVYGVPVDPVAVAMVLGRQPDEYEVHRPDAGAHQQVSTLEPVNLQGAVIEAASILGPDAKAKQIAEHLERTRRLLVDEPYIRAALSRAAKKPQSEPEAKPMEGGYA